MMKLVCAFCLLLTLCNAANPAKKTRSTQPKKPPAFKHPLTRMASSAAGVDTSFFFPDHSDKKIPMGELVTVLCHFENNAKSPLNITSMMGSLNDNVNFAIYVQNYTQKALGVIVKPGIL
jgi:Translocon-associated protein (TRAP), alpha subunit